MPLVRGLAVGAGFFSSAGDFGFSAILVDRLRSTPSVDVFRGAIIWNFLIKKKGNDARKKKLRPLGEGLYRWDTWSAQTTTVGIKNMVVINIAVRI